MSYNQVRVYIVYMFQSVTRPVAAHTHGLSVHDRRRSFSTGCVTVDVNHDGPFLFVNFCFYNNLNM